MLRLALLLALIPAVASAQIMNVNSELVKDVKQGFSATLDGAVDYRYGNSRLLLASGTGLVRYFRGRHHFFATAKVEYGVKDNASAVVNRDAEHLRWRMRLRRPLDLEVFTQHDRDEFRRIGLRMLAGAGPRVRFISEKEINISASLAFMDEFVRYNAGADGTPGYTVTAVRLSLVANVSVRASKLVTISETVYMQPRVDDPRDVRALEQADLVIAISAKLSLKESLTLTLDSRPASGVHPLDLATTWGLSLALP